MALGLEERGDAIDRSSPGAASGARPADPSDCGPAHSTIVATAGRPRIASGTNGAAGAVMSASPPHSSRGADIITSRDAVSTRQPERVAAGTTTSV
jgi:hypothetical protein